MYVPQLRTWYDSKTHTEVLSSSVMGTVESSISTAGLTGVDKLLAFLIVTELQVINSFYVVNLFIDMSRNLSWYSTFVIYVIDVLIFIKD